MGDDGRRRVVEALDRIDPSLGAFITVDADAALRQAASAPAGRLSGVPIAVKDIIDVAGMRTTYGSARFADHVPKRTAPAVAALRAEGAVVIGKANLQEFAFGVTGYNPHYGPTLNPADRSRTAAGSSGGSAAAVASGVCRIAVGTDTSGSVRLPAASCGIWGFKCAGGTALPGVHPLAPSFDSLGFLTAGPDDLALVLGIAELPGPGTVRAGFAGVDLEVPALPAEHWTVFGAETWQVHGRAVTDDPGSYGADVRARLRPPREDVAAARRVEAAWRRRYAEAVRGYDVVVDLVLDGAAPLLADAVRDYERGESLVRQRLIRHTPAANGLGWPALAFPTAEGPRQVLGPPGSEAALLAVARELSARD